MEVVLPMSLESGVSSQLKAVNADPETSSFVGVFSDSPSMVLNCRYVDLRHAACGFVARFSVSLVAERVPTCFARCPWRVRFRARSLSVNFTMGSIDRATKNAVVLWEPYGGSKLKGGWIVSVL